MIAPRSRRVERAISRWVVDAGVVVMATDVAANIREKIQSRVLPLTTRASAEVLRRQRHATIVRRITGFVTEAADDVLRVRPQPVLAASVVRKPRRRRSASHRPWHPTWRRIGARPSYCGSYSTWAFRMGSSHAVQGAPRPLPAHSFTGASRGSTPPSTLSRTSSANGFGNYTLQRDGEYSPRWRGSQRYRR